MCRAARVHGRGDAPADIAPADAPRDVAPAYLASVDVASGDAPADLATRDDAPIDLPPGDGAAHLATMIHAMRAAGGWQDRRAANLLDGGCPFYGTYETADGQYMAVGALEQQFYEEFVALLGIGDRAPDRKDVTRCEINADVVLQGVNPTLVPREQQQKRTPKERSA